MDKVKAGINHHQQSADAGLRRAARAELVTVTARISQPKRSLAHTVARCSVRCDQSIWPACFQAPAARAHRAGAMRDKEAAASLAYIQRTLRDVHFGFSPM
jgi:hypothetical protein